MTGKFLVKQHKDDSNRDPHILHVHIDGSALTTTSSTAGVTRGAEVVLAKDDGSNTVTITFNETMKSAEYGVWFTVKTADCCVKMDTIAKTTSTLVYSTVKHSDLTTAVADADVDILILANDETTII